MADIAPDPGAHVWGALFELPDRCLEALDAKEGEGFAYRRVELELEHDGAAVPAQAYELMERADEEIPPRPDYLALLVDGARERGLPGTGSPAWSGSSSLQRPMAERPEPLRKTASYEAEPGEVGACCCSTRAAWTRA